MKGETGKMRMRGNFLRRHDGAGSGIFLLLRSRVTRFGELKLMR
jgi:hypothetical protein